jgi:hypothetical protein
VVIPASVTYIGTCALESCTSLTSVKFLGLTAPQTGTNWVYGNLNAVGHAFNNSNFPAPGEVFNGLSMGETITIGQLLGDDPVPLIWWLSIVVVIVAAVLGAMFLSSGLKDRKSTAPAYSPPAQRNADGPMVKGQNPNANNDLHQPPPIRDRVSRTQSNDQINGKCPWCGAQTADSMFCRHCGGKLQG